MDAKTLARWRRMAEASAPGLVAEESCRRIELHDGDGVMAMTDAATKQDHDNANFWAEARAMVLELVAEVEKLKRERCGFDCDRCEKGRADAEREEQNARHFAELEKQEAWR